MLSLVQAKGEVMPFTGHFISQISTGMMEGKVRLSDVGEVHVQFLASLLQARLDNRASLNLIQSAFDAFRRSSHAAEAPIFLIGEILNSETYQQFFRTTYNQVHPEPDDQSKQLLIECFQSKPSAPASNPPHAEPPAVPVVPIIAPPITAPPVPPAAKPATPPPTDPPPVPVVEPPKTLPQVPPAGRPEIPPPVRRVTTPAAPVAPPPPLPAETGSAIKPAIPPPAIGKPPIPAQPVPHKPALPPPKRK